MKVFFIRRKVIINIILVIAVSLVSLVYTDSITVGAFGRLLNNERIMPIYGVDTPDKKIALTFDTAWGEQYLQNTMDVLKRYNVKATFFIVGKWAERYPELTLNIYNDDHEIGNHSLNHMQMTKLSKNETLAEIKDAEVIIENITGERPRLFRAPFGEYNNMLVSGAKDLNYSMIQWNIDSLDLEGFNNQEIIDRVVSKADNGAIVLLHTNTQSTPEVLPQIIEKLRKNGYKFVKVSELLLKENYYIDSTGRQKPLLDKPK